MSKSKTLPTNSNFNNANMSKTLATTMEPAIQAKKRVESSFIKTSPVKSEPCIQSKKRVASQDLIHTDPVNKSSENKSVPIQSKKTVCESPEPHKSTPCEPPLQSKRRTPGPATTLSNGFYDKNAAPHADFALLGNQDKFSNNVKYKVQVSHGTRDLSPPKQMKLQKKTMKENRDPSPAPVVNTEQFRKPATPLAPRKPKDQSAPMIQQLKDQKGLKEPKVMNSPKMTENEVRKSQAKMEVKKNLDSAEPVKDSMKAKKLGHMNEFAQTNMEKGIAQSAPEAPAEYALQYKAGVAPSRHIKKVSEYQKQFAWKSGMPASPLLNAEQIVYNSNPQLSPPKKCIIPKVTEYQKQYKAYKMVPVPSEEVPVVPQKKSKIQRSKSMEDLSPAEIRTAGSSPTIAAGNSRLTFETDQKPRQEPAPIVPRRKARNTKSEYLSNFKPPGRFDYLRGSWSGAMPPHLQIQGPEDCAPTPGLSNWFSEVLELRRKAKEYSVRAQGTHFSREHLLQLMARQTDMWDQSTTTARSTVSALSLESGLSSVRDTAQQQERKHKAYRASNSVAATMASEDEHLSDTEDSSPAETAPGRKKLAWTEEESPVTPSTISVISGEGRLTTPAMRTKVQSGKGGRHHLDRTTPSVGGALLSSPPQPGKKRSGKKMVTRSIDSCSVGDEYTPRSESVCEQAPVVHKPLAGQKTYTTDQGLIAPTPTFGMPSLDSHFLRDDTASNDRGLTTQFVHNPSKGRGNNPGGLMTIDEGFGQTYSKSKANVTKKDMCWTYDGGQLVPRLDVDQDDDVLSVSMQSVASSCSVASATLERARKRKDEFWGKGGIVTK